jgi:hypothetical protein
MTSDRRRRKQPEPKLAHLAEDALKGLPPRLVINLARLAGTTLGDLGVTLQLMPYGYRAALVAYGLIEMSEPDKTGVRRVQAQPFCLEVIAAAAELIASLADPAEIAAALADANDSGEPNPPYAPAVSAADDNPQDEVVIEARVESAQPLDDKRLMLSLALAPQMGLSLAREPYQFRLVTDIDAKLAANTEVEISYSTEDLLRATPNSIAEKVYDRH